MSQISYYSTKKTYSPLEISMPDSNINLELTRYEKKLGFTIDSDDAKVISNPMLLICGKKALVRTNRYTFFNIEIADDMWPLLRHCDNIEMYVNTDISSVETVYIGVQRVLHFPDTLKLDMWKQEADFLAMVDAIDTEDAEDDAEEDGEDDDDEGDDDGEDDDDDGDDDDDE